MNKKLLEWAKSNWQSDVDSYFDGHPPAYDIAPTLAICLQTEAIKEQTKILEEILKKMSEK